MMSVKFEQRSPSLEPKNSLNSSWNFSRFITHCHSISDIPICDWLIKEDFQ